MDRDDDFDDLPDEERAETPAVQHGSVELPDDLLSNDEPRQRSKPTPPPPGARITKAQRQIRVATVAQMIVNGFKRRDIIAYVNEKLLVQWDGLSERGIDRLIRDATKIIESEAVTNVVLETGKAKARLDDLYRRSVGANLFGTAARVQKQLNRMLGLDAPIALRHGNDPANPMPVPITQSGPFIVLIQEVEEG